MGQPRMDKPEILATLAGQGGVVVLRVSLNFALFRLFAFFCLFLFLYFFSTRYIRDSSFTKQECKMHIILNQIIIV
jgi:hypothetical protein